MSIRIYALAKKLNIDNNKLIEICDQIGITGKGSALASLSDEEAAQIKAHLEHGKGRAGAVAPAGSPAASGGQSSMRREDYIAPSGATTRKVPVLERKPERVVGKRTAPAVPAGHTAAPPTVSAVGVGTQPLVSEAAPTESDLQEPRPAEPEPVATAAIAVGATLVPATEAPVQATIVAPVVAEVVVQTTAVDEPEVHAVEVPPAPPRSSRRTNPVPRWYRKM